MLINYTAFVKSPARLFAAIVVGCLLAAGSVTASLPPGLAEAGDKRFAIFRNGEEIGSHLIAVRSGDDATEIRTEIDIRVTFAFLTLYDYSHRATEIWRGGQLVSLRAKTDNDGKPEFVDLEGGADGFTGTSSEGRLDLPPSVGFTSYWNLAYLKAGQWLDTQDGKLLSMDIEPHGTETIDLRGNSVPAERYHAKVDDGTEVDLWYAADGLVRMRFRAFDGSILDYILQ